MRKKIVTLIIAILLIANIIGAAFIFFDIQIMQAPDITIGIDVLDVNPNEAIIDTQIEVYNPNSFEMVAKDFEITTTTTSDDTVIHTKMDGGVLPPHETTKFYNTIVIDLKGNSPSILNTKLSGTAGMNIGFIQKTVPISVSVKTSMEDVLDKIEMPFISIKANLEDITQKSISISSIIDVYNPNSIEISIEDSSMTIVTETGKNVGNLVIEDGIIEAKSSAKIKASGEILLDALNYKTLTANISGKISVKIANFTKSLPLNINAEIGVPNLEEMLGQDAPVDIMLWIDFKLGKGGLEGDITFEIINPTKLDLFVKDVTVTLYGTSGKETKFINTCCVGDMSGNVVKAHNTTPLEGEITIPFSVLIPKFGEKLLDGVLVLVRANVTLDGLDQTFWLGVGGHQDIRLLR